MIFNKKIHTSLKKFSSLVLLLLLLSRFSRVQLYATPETAAHQAPLSLGFSRQHWSGLPFPSPMRACILSQFSCVQLCATLRTAAHQAPLSTGFSRQEYWSRLPFPSPPWCYYTLNINHIDIISKSINYITPKKWHIMSDYKLFSNISKCYYRHYMKNFGSMLCSIIFLLKVKLFLLNNSYTHNFLIYSRVVNSIGFNSSKLISPSLSLSVQSFFSYSPPDLCFPQLCLFFFFFFFNFWPCHVASSQTRDQTHTRCSGSAKS